MDANDIYGLKGKAALITGGGSGIGRAAAVLFARLGASVTIADIDASGAEATAALVAEAGGRGRVARCDVSSPEEVRALVAGAVQAFGRLDCAVNAAGLSIAEGGVEGCSDGLWSRILAVNLAGTYQCVKHEAAAMAATGGAIVNVSSIAGFVGSTQQPAYVASKHGVIGVTKSAAMEFAPRGIRVNAVCPGFVHTPMTQSLLGDHAEAVARGSSPMGRGGQPEELAHPMVWLCSAAAGYVTGTTLLVDGGWLAGAPNVWLSGAAAGMPRL